MIRFLLSLNSLAILREKIIIFFLKENIPKNRVFFNSYIRTGEVLTNIPSGVKTPWDIWVSSFFSNLRRHWAGISLGKIEMLYVLIFLFLLYQSVLSKWLWGFKLTLVPPLNVMSLEVKKYIPRKFFSQKNRYHILPWIIQTNLNCQ